MADDPRHEDKVEQAVADRSLKAGYEVSDVNAGRITAYLAIIGASFVVSLLIVGGILLLGRPDRPPVTMAERQEVRDGIRLELTQKSDREALEAAARHRIDHYGWQDGAKTIAAIPIDRAIALLAAHGWPDTDDRRDTP